MTTQAARLDPPPESPIRRPDNPEHSMVLEYVRGTATAYVRDRVIARSRRALLVREFAGRALAPVVYFPPQDVRAQLLQPSSATSSCALKGSAVSFDIATDPPVRNGAWSYHETHDFDRRLTELECCVAFDRRLVRVEVTPSR